MWSKRPRRSLQSSITAPTYSFGTMTDALMYGSSTDSISFGISAGLCTSSQSPPGRVQDAVGDVRRGDEQVEVELALEPLAHDLHVQQAEEAAAEAEAERLRGLRLVEERRVVQLQPLERVAQLGVLVRVGREEPGEDHRLDVLVAGQRLGGGLLLGGEGVADAQLDDVLQPGDHVADLAGRERRRGRRRRREEAELLRLEARALRHRAQPLARLETAVDDADERDDAAVLVVRGVEDRARAPVRRRRRPAPGSARRSRRAPSSTPSPVFAEMRSTFVGVVADELGDLRRGRRPGSACGRSILFTTGTISRSFSIAR